MGMTLGTPIKSLVEAALEISGVAALSRWRRRGDAVILAFHNIVPRGESAAGDPSLHLPQQQFSDQLDRLLETHDVVTLEALESPGSRGSRPRAVITFDDAYRGAMTAGLEEVGRRALPAIVFVPPGCLGQRSFWWDAIRTAAGDPPPESFRREALTVYEGCDGPIRERARELGLSVEEVPDHARPVTEGELQGAVDRPGISFGSHSWSHPNLACLSGERLVRELVEPLGWLGERIRPGCHWLAYPYGLRAPIVEREAARAGYRGAVLIDGGWQRGALTEPFTVPRVNIPSGVSTRGFALRCAGWFCE
jgi:peptidoglycan/xylan/chitin deacetylase (PgdA/CDA1 family)